MGIALVSLFMSVYDLISETIETSSFSYLDHFVHFNCLYTMNITNKCVVNLNVYTIFVTLFLVKLYNVPKSGAVVINMSNFTYVLCFNVIGLAALF